MSQQNGGGRFQALHLDDAFSEDEVDKHILNILAHLSRIFHGFLNHGTGFMHTQNERDTQTISSLHIFYKRWVAQLICTSLSSLTISLRDLLQYKM